VTDQAPHPSQQQGKIIMLHTLIIKFLYKKRENKTSGTEWQQVSPEFNLFLTSS
jgi:hypothetical protein